MYDELGEKYVICTIALWTLLKFVNFLCLSDANRVQFKTCKNHIKTHQVIFRILMFNFRL